MKLAARVAAVLLSALAVECAAGEPKPSGFATHVLPLLDKYCVECHRGDKPKGELNLDRYRDPASIAAHRDVWDAVLERVETATMPPEDKPQPTAGERAAIIGWLAAEFRRADANAPPDPGHVTIRRLNRAEYNNTIRDLVGVDFQPAADFPRDDVGYGFDNIGDVLSLSPILLERYLAAAEAITSRAIVADPAALTTLHFDPSRMSNTLRARERDHVLPLVAEGEVFTTFEFPHEVEVAVTVVAHGDPAVGEPARMAILVNGQIRDTFDVSSNPQLPGEYRAPARLPAGKSRVSAAFINDYYDPQNPDPDKRDRNLFIHSLEIQSQDGTPLQRPPATHERIIFRTPDTAADWEPCTREILQRFATRAFRRPVEDAEITPLVKIARRVVDDGGTFERGIQVALQAILVSPQFLFRVELDDRPQVAGPQYIGDDALAARLSYFLWSSLPDEELLARAADGTLRRDDVLEAQVRRMLADPKSIALVQNFGGQWLQTRSLENVTPNRRLYRQFNETLRSSMAREAEMFLATILAENRSLLELVDADFVVINEQLAKLYGIEGVKGKEFRRVALDDHRRGGVITMAAVLTVTSGARSTSPVKRGKWILENVLGTPPPAPPPGVPTLPENERGQLTGTLRQRLEQHRADPGCASCHRRMDPLGFGLENFDAVGVWRDADRDEPIDASGELPDGATFRGPVELKEYLLTRPDDFTRCLTEKMLTYALGRGLEAYDRASVDKIVEAVERRDYALSALIVEIAKSQPFQMRRGPE